MKRIIIGISGASCAIIGIELLQELRQHEDIETHLVITKGGEVTIKEETDYSVEEVKSLADYCHDVENMAAPVASGTFEVFGMIVAPCSMKTLAGVANGFCENLLLRAADATLKESRPLVLITRETPLSTVHLKNMLAAKEAGAVILPPALSFYNKPQTLLDSVRYIVGKALRALGIKAKDFKGWGEQK
ncbi:MAG: UbiX family flavin prenyltransferase [Selenomonadaceae bacterium]|nr:UbiX family flavin prenyltransferase [Selenomonadaceae bacterium]